MFDEGQSRDAARNAIGRHSRAATTLAAFDGGVVN